MLRAVARIAAVGAAVTVPIGAYAFVIRPWARSWGVDPTEAATVLPGDGIIPDATAVETRAITIDADPADVWPWLLQMGYGKAGFYSYDRLDTKGVSSTELMPDWQTIEVGSVLPTHPDGGFEVRILEPGRALVMYVDSAMAEQWKLKAEAKRAEAEAVEGEATVSEAAEGELPGPEAVRADMEKAIRAKVAEKMPAGVRGSGAILGTSMPSEFAGTWAFVLQPTPEGTTRLIERLRFRFGGEPQPGQEVALRALGFGIFLMVRKQLLGIRDRAEHLAMTKVPAPYVPPAFEPQTVPLTGEPLPV